MKPATQLQLDPNAPAPTADYSRRRRPVFDWASATPIDRNAPPAPPEPRPRIPRPPQIERISIVREQCRTCAFRPGCTTHEDEPHNRLKAMICELAAVPFYCHQGTDWRNHNLHGLEAEQAMALRRTMPVCEGWRQAVGRSAAEGRYPKDMAGLRRLIGVRALQLLAEFLHGEEAVKEAAKINLERVLQMLARVAPRRAK